jgi:hypothetical protein
VRPSGDPGQSLDEGTGVDIPSASAAFDGVPLVDVRARAATDVTQVGGSMLECTFTVAGAPDDQATVFHVTISGKGAHPVPLLHPGEEAVGSRVTTSGLDHSQVRVTQPVADPSGPYGCEMVAVTTADGAAQITGRPRATTVP